MEKIEELRAQLQAVNAEYAQMRTLPPEERKSFGQRLNAQKQKIQQEMAALTAALENEAEPSLDVTAPMAPNQPRVELATGSAHPLMQELDRIVEIYVRMGFNVMESRQLDDEFHMFDSLNFPKDHPARDDYDTFRTAEGLIPPAHTSTMQNRALRQSRAQLENGGEIAVVMPGRVFRNEDVDATHEHTFYQCEGVYVAKGATLAQMLGVLRHFFETYYGQSLRIKTQPGYFPFTEPSLEFLIEKPASLGGKGDGWLEMLGCGMIHPQVLRMAEIDPEVYQGFAWGGGIERLVMLKYGINDIRQFEAGKLEFLEQF